MTHYRLSFNGPIFEQQMNALCHRVAVILEQPNFASLSVLFSSEGGNVEQGFALYNFLRSLPQPVDMHAMGHIGVAGLPVFLAGRRRKCVPVSRFILSAVEGALDGRRTVDRFAVEVQRLESNIRLSQEVCRRHARLPETMLEALRRGTAVPVVLTAPEARDFGLADEVAELNPEGTPQPDTVLWTVGWQQS